MGKLMFTKKFQTGHIRKIFIANIADPRKFIYAKYFNISDGFYLLKISE